MATVRPPRARPAARSRPAVRAMGAVLAVVALAACSGGGTKTVVSATPFTFDFTGSAAVVNGEDVPAQVLADQLAGFKAAPGAVKPAFGQDDIRQAGSDQPAPGVVAQLLSTEIYARVIGAEVQARQLPVADSIRTVAETEVKGQFGDALDNAPVLRAQLVDRFALYVTLDRALSPDAPDEAAIRAAFDKDPGQWVQVCAHHILLDTEAQARDVLAKLRAGADFAELAKASSKDPGSGAAGGDLGCTPKGQYVAEFEKAVWDGPVGELQGPVQTQFGFHIIRVDKRGTLTFEEARPQIIQQLSPRAFQPLSDWLKTKMPTVAVTVDPRFGTWDAAAGEVNPIGTPTSTLQIEPAPSTQPSAATAPTTPVTGR